MRRALSMLIACLLLTACASGPDSATELDAANTDSADPRAIKDSPHRCPAGHTAIRKVPILYGTPDFLPEMRAAEERLEIIWAGGEARHDSPTHELVCETCRYRRGQSGAWSRFAANPDAFGVPLTDLIRHLPVRGEGSVTTEPAFTQHIRGRARQEEFSFSTTEPLLTLEPRLMAYFRDAGVTAIQAHKPLDLDGVALDARWGDYTVASEIIDLPGGQRRAVRLAVTRGKVWAVD